MSSELLVVIPQLRIRRYPGVYGLMVGVRQNPVGEAVDYHTVRGGKQLIELGPVARPKGKQGHGPVGIDLRIKSENFKGRKRGEPPHLRAKDHVGSRNSATGAYEAL